MIAGFNDGLAGSFNLLSKTPPSFFSPTWNLNFNLLSLIWGYLELIQIASEISNLSSCLLSNWVKPSFLCTYITGRTYTVAVVFSFPHTGAPEQEYRQRHKKKDRCRVYSYPTPLYVSTPFYVQLNSYPTLHPCATVSLSKLKCIIIQPPHPSASVGVKPNHCLPPTSINICVLDAQLFRGKIAKYRFFRTQMCTANLA